MSRKRTPHDFLFKEELGRGSYSTVYRVLDKATKYQYAVKVCSKRHIVSENKVKYVTIEKNTLNALGAGHHPGIIRLYYTFHDQENLYFLLDYAPGGELLQLLRKHGVFNETWSRHLMCQLVDTVEYIHSMKIIHRDLKPENVLLDAEGKLMITDFGAAFNVSESAQRVDVFQQPVRIKASSFVGTAEYVSPELLLENTCCYGSDIWALGCMLYQFLQGVPPFRGQNELETFEKIVHLNYSWAIPVSSSAMHLVSQILMLDPAKRFTINDIKQHKWFSTINWQDKASIWKGVGSLPYPSDNNKKKTPSAFTPAPVVEVCINNLPVPIKRRKKPAKGATSTATIAEWRRTLGLTGNTAGFRQSLGVGGLPTPPRTSPPSITGHPVPITNQKTPTPTAQPLHVPVLTSVLSSPAKPRLQGNRVTAHPPVVRQQLITTSTPGDKGLKSCTPIDPLSAPNVIKQDWATVLCIPHKSIPFGITRSSYSEINDDLLMGFMPDISKDLRDRLRLSLLSLDYSGKLSYIQQNLHHHISFITDSDLSIYDFQMTEAKGKRYLILEKFKSMVWIICPTSNSLSDCKRINVDQSWIDCFFQQRQQAEKSLRYAVKVNHSPTATDSRTPSPELIERPVMQAIDACEGPTPPSTTASLNVPRYQVGLLPTKTKSSSNMAASHSPIKSTLNSGTNAQKVASSYVLPSNMVASSSRYEVLHAVNYDNMRRNGVATSGASAAFKNLQVRR